MTRYRAIRAPVHRGVSGWNAILGPAPPSRRLEGAATADIAVIGAGFAGLSAARRIGELDPKARVTVLEAGRVGEGAAGRNSGFMIDLPHNLPGGEQTAARGEKDLIALNRQAQDFAERAVEDFDINRGYFDRAGKINGAVDARTEALVEHERKHLKEIGERFEMLDAKAMAEVTGSNYYRAGIFTPGTVMLQPAGYIRGLAAGLVRAGVDLFEESPATAFHREGTGWVISTPGGEVQAGKIILAVNGHLESFGVARGRLMQVFLFGAMTPELTGDQLLRLGGQSRWGITPADPMGATVRRIDEAQGGNRIIIRAAAVHRSGMKARAFDLARAQRTMQRRFEARFPTLKGLRMAQAWAGHLCLSLNGVAVMGEIDWGVYSACVQNGLGTARGTLTGIGAAEMALGVDSDITRRFSAEPEPKKLPPSPLKDIGINAALRWKEWRARNA